MVDPGRIESLLLQLEQRETREVESPEVRFLAWESDPAALYRILVPVVTELANLRGGTAICGVDTSGRGPADITGCGPTDTVALRRMISRGTAPGIPVTVTTFDFRGRQLLVVEVPEGMPPHYFQAEPAVGPGAAREALEFPASGLSDFTAQVLDVGDEAIDPLEVERLRNILRARQSGSSLLPLANGELLPELGIIDSATGRLTAAGLLLVGREAALRRFLPGHETVYLHLKDETTYDRRIDSNKPLLALLDDLTRQLETHNRLYTLKVGLFQYEIPDFPTEVIREALLNAFMHRDYASLGPVYVRVYADRLEITNPGPLLGGITPDNIMSHEPVTRNRRLAEVLQRLRLVERSGLGVRRMYTIQLSYGKEPPVYIASPADVRVILRSGRTDENFARFIAKRQQQGEEFALNELIVLSYLRRNQELDLHETTRIVQRSDNEAHETLGAMVKRGLLEPFGQKKGRVYRLSKAVYAELRQSVEYYLHRDAEAAYAEAAITGYIGKNGFITNAIVRTLLRVNRSQSSYLLQRLVKSGKLVLTGKGTRTRYTLPGAP